MSWEQLPAKMDCYHTFSNTLYLSLTTDRVDWIYTSGGYHAAARTSFGENERDDRKGNLPCRRADPLHPGAEPSNESQRQYGHGILWPSGKRRVDRSAPPVGLLRLCQSCGAGAKISRRESRENRSEPGSTGGCRPGGHGYHSQPVARSARRRDSQHRFVANRQTEPDACLRIEAFSPAEHSLSAGTGAQTAAHPDCPAVPRFRLLPGTRRHRGHIGVRGGDEPGTPGGL